LLEFNAFKRYKVKFEPAKPSLETEKIPVKSILPIDKFIELNKESA